MELNCGFTKENKWFRYRAAAIIIEDGCVLFAGNELQDYFYSVGGAVLVGESAQEAVAREVYEETGIHYEIDHLAVIHENFFCEANRNGILLDCHEICLYYFMKPRGSKQLSSDSYTQGVKEQMFWIPLAELEKHKAYPAFLANYLRKEHFGIEHIISDERNGKIPILQA